MEEVELVCLRFLWLLISNTLLVNKDVKVKEDWLSSPISIQWLSNLPVNFKALRGALFVLITDPRPPDNVVIQDQTESTLVVTWDPPSSGLYKSFELSYDQDTSATFTPIAVTPLPGTDRSFTVTGLRSNTAYQVRLQTVYDSAISNAVDLVGTTGKIWIINGNNNRVFIKCWFWPSTMFMAHEHYSLFGFQSPS